MLKTFFGAIIRGLAAIGRGFVAFVAGFFKITTWPLRWVYVKTRASKFGLWLWALSVDPPAIRVMHFFWIIPALGLIGSAIDRKFVLGDPIKNQMNLEDRLQSLGQANIACNAERNEWEKRALIAEDKYATLMKRDPIPELDVKPAIAPAPAPVVKRKRAPARIKTNTSAPSGTPKGWPSWLPY